MPPCPHRIHESRVPEVDRQVTYQVRPVPELPCDWSFTFGGQETRSLRLGAEIGGFRVAGFSAAHVVVEATKPDAYAELVLTISCPNCGPDTRTATAAVGPEVAEPPGVLETALDVVFEGVKWLLSPVTLLYCLICRAVDAGNLSCRLACAALPSGLKKLLGIKG